jgi:hypothetical protein
MTPKPASENIDAIWKLRKISDEEITSGEAYHIFPLSVAGRIAFAFVFIGLIVFLSGIFMGSTGHEMSSYIALCGMGIYFISGLIRLRFD